MESLRGLYRADIRASVVGFHFAARSGDEAAAGCNDDADDCNAVAVLGERNAAAPAPGPTPPPIISILPLVSSRIGFSSIASNFCKKGGKITR